MAVISTAPVYKAALVAALRADGTLGAGQVTYGSDPRNLERESVEVGNINYPEEVWSAIGAQKKDETYSIKVYVFVTTPNLTQQEATERCYVLLGRVETIMRANITMTGVLWSALVPQNLLEQPGDEGFMAMAEADVVVRARK